MLVTCADSVYGRGRKLDKAVEMFNAAQSMGLTLDEKAYMNLISYYGKAGMVLLNISVISEMHKNKTSFLLNCNSYIGFILGKEEHQ